MYSPGGRSRRLQRLASACGTRRCRQLHARVGRRSKILHPIRVEDDLAGTGALPFNGYRVVIKAPSR